MSRKNAWKNFALPFMNLIAFSISCIRADRYDYDDMINWVIRAFQENEQLLRRYQEKFQYILVDEFQDTSGTQNKLVNLLINFWDKPNIFVVGDEDQSIFRFQGANIYNIEEFAAGYRKRPVYGGINQ